LSETEKNEFNPLVSMNIFKKKNEKFGVDEFVLELNLPYDNSMKVFYSSLLEKANEFSPHENSEDKIFFNGQPHEWTGRYDNCNKFLKVVVDIQTNKLECVLLFQFFLLHADLDVEEMIGSFSSIPYSLGRNEMVFLDRGLKTNSHALLKISRDFSRESSSHAMVSKHIIHEVFDKILLVSAL